METFRSEPVISPDPTAEETAAILAAIAAHREALRRHRHSTEVTPAEWWREHAWSLSGRFESLNGTRITPDERLPTDPWRAADRSKLL